MLTYNSRSKRILVLSDAESLMQYYLNAINI